MLFARFFRGSQGRRRAHARARHHSADRGGRRRGRLQPRQPGAHRHAECARFDRPDAVEGRANPQRRPARARRPPAISPPCSTGRKRATSRSPRSSSLAAAGQLQPDGHRHRDVNTMFWRLIGQQQVNITATGEVVWGIKKLNLALALDNTGSMASSGKMTALKEAAHNLLDHAQERREDAGRHQGVDRSVRDRRQCRHRQRQRDLDRLDRLGGSQRHLQQHQLYDHKTQLPVAQQDLDARRTTAPGTAASTTATRTTTCSTPRPAPAARRPCTAPTRLRPARPR